MEFRMMFSKTDNICKYTWENERTEQIKKNEERQRDTLENIKMDHTNFRRSFEAASTLQTPKHRLIQLLAMFSSS
jgi:hypothetical protein